MSRRIPLTFRATFLLCSITVLASADTFVVLGSRAAQNPTDTMNWAQLGPVYSQMITARPVVTTHGNQGLVGKLNQSGYERVNEGTGRVGNFSYGQPLLWTGHSSHSVSAPMGVYLTNPVSSFGFDIAADYPGAFSVDVKAYDVHMKPLFEKVFHGVSSGAENGSALFVGVRDLTGANIKGFVISSSSGNMHQGWANDFAIDSPTFTYSAVPEPASLALGFTSALLGAGLVLRRKFAARS